MIKLHIKDKGFFIDIPGLPPFRTPVEIDITTMDAERIKIELKKIGINNFVIKYDNEEQIKKDKPKTKVKNKSVVTKIVEKIVKPSIDLNQIFERFDNIDKAISKISNKPVTTTEQEYKKPEKEPEVEVDGFIPTVDTSDIKLGGSSEYSRVEDEKEKNLENKGKTLSKFVKDNGFKK